MTERRVNSVLLVRDLMTIGVPVCRDSEACGAVLARLEQQTPGVLETPGVCVVLDDDGMACGWATRETLAAADPARPLADVMDEDIPTVPPDIPASAAAQLMRDRGVEYQYLLS